MRVQLQRRSRGRRRLTAACGWPCSRERREPSSENVHESAWPASSVIAATPNGNGSPLGIGEVAKTVGLSPSTLRAWEAAGLSSPQRDAWGRRWYSRSETERVCEIKRLREEQRLSLREITID